MQYDGQTNRTLKNRFGEHNHRMKKPKQFDTFLYQHFKCTDHSPKKHIKKILHFKKMEKITYQENSSNRFKIIKRHEMEMKMN